MENSAEQTADEGDDFTFFFAMPLPSSEDGHDRCDAPKSKVVAATIELPDASAHALLDSFAKQEDVPPHLVHHFHCAYDALLWEEDEAISSAEISLSAVLNDDRRQEVSSFFSSHGGPGDCVPGDLETESFQSAFQRVIADRDSRKMLAHLETMFAADLHDLTAHVASRAKAEAVAKSPSPTTEERQVQGDKIPVASTSLPRKGVQEDLEIMSMKEEQRAGFREFVLKQSQLLRSAPVEEVQPCGDENENGTTRKSLQPKSFHKRSAKLTKEMYHQIVKHGFTAYMGDILESQLHRSLHSEVEGVDEGGSLKFQSSTMMNCYPSQDGYRKETLLACFGQQVKRIVSIDVLTMPSVKADISSLFRYSQEQERSTFEREINLEWICNSKNMSGLVLPLLVDGAVAQSFQSLSEKTTNFVFDSVKMQIDDVTCHESDDTFSALQAGGSIVTKHANLMGLHVVFHFARDGSYASVLEKAGSDGTSEGKSLQRKGDGPVGRALREMLSNGLNEIFHAADQNGLRSLFIPCDLYSPTGGGFGTQDFAALVKDTRKFLLELSRNQNTDSSTLANVKFVMTGKSVEDESFFRVIANCVREEFSQHLYQL